MSLPTSEPLPSDEDPSSPARRRRLRRSVFSAGPTSRVELLDALARSVIPSIDFFLLSTLSGLILLAAILLDARALFVLAALAGPFMAPAAGLSLATVIGSWSFFLQSLASLSVGSLLVFICGMAAGWAARYFPNLSLAHSMTYADFSWPEFVLVAIGSVAMAVLLVRKPEQKPIAPSIALVYGLYLPVGLAGFGITSGVPGFWPDGLTLFAMHLGWAALAGTIALFVMGLRPFNVFGYALGASFAMAGIAALIMVSALGLTMYPSGPGLVAQPTALAALTDTPQPSATLTSTPIPLTATATITATSTAAATTTLSPSPNPTAVQARVRPNEFGGVLVRAEPDYAAPVVKSLLNDSMVEILPDDQQQGNTTWVKVKTTDGIIGWIVRALLMTATPPAP